MEETIFDYLDQLDCPDDIKEKLKGYVKGLQDDRLLLECLQAAGIDNTDAYEYGIELYHEQKGEEE